MLIIFAIIVWLAIGLVAHLCVERKYGRHTELLPLGMIYGPLSFLALRD